MKNFFCVTSKFFDDGTTYAEITKVRSEVKPEDTVIHKRDVHTYIDWFDTMEEAASSADKCRRISRRVRR